MRHTAVDMEQNAQLLDPKAKFTRLDKNICVGLVWYCYIQV